MKLLDQYREKNKKWFSIAIDGGINEETAKEGIENSANKVIIGRGFFKDPSIEDRL